MSDYCKGLTVAFDSPLDEETTDCIASAIRMIVHVAGVDKSLDKYDDHMNRMMATTAIRKKLIGILFEENKK